MEATSSPTEYPTPPERKVFPSRKTSFPIFAADVGDGWLQLLNLAMRIGTERRTAAGERRAEALNTVVTVGLAVIAEDLEVKAAPREDFPCYLEASRAVFREHHRALAPYAERIAIDEANDLAAVGVVPSLISATFDVIDGDLYGSFVLRSIDVYADWPPVAMALMRLHRRVAERFELGVGASTFVIHRAHLHEREWQRALDTLAEHFRRPLPLQVDHSGVFLFGNDGGRARGMLLDHDAGNIFWEDAFADPQALSWYIVDAMPWLLPQHIRYVGQECASLARAMQAGECYLQG